MKLFKILFSIIFLLLTIVWIVFTINYFGWTNWNWEWVNKIPGINKLNTIIQDYIGNSTIKLFGFKAVLIGGTIILGYATIFYPLKKIPILGSIIKALTFIIPTIGSMILLFGILLMVVNFSGVDKFIDDVGNFIPKQLITNTTNSLLMI